MIKGYTLLGQALARAGVDTGFYIMGGPINDGVKAAMANGVRMIDVRHEQAAAMMAQAYSRIRLKPGFCMGASGPGAINLTTGLANALVDCAPVVAMGGASPLNQLHTGSFQEIDQLAIMRPVTKWADRVLEARRIPEYVALAFRHAMSGKPGPVYLDLPGDVLYKDVDEDTVIWPKTFGVTAPRVAAGEEVVKQIVEALGASERPIILSGSGTLWSDASEDLTALVDALGIPFYTTPQGRGVLPEDHSYFFAHARSQAYKQADLIFVVGTRLNYVFSQGKPPRFAEDAKIVRIDIDPAELAQSDHVDIPVLGDARTVLRQLRQACEGTVTAERFKEWRKTLAQIEADKAPKSEQKLATDQIPIHPLRLCKEIRDFIGRDTILVVDGQEILNFGRQSIPSYLPGHRLNSGPFGTMGVGLPFGVGAKAARPDKDVLVLHGDGSFGLNAMELDTAVRHDLPVLVVISLNGGWTADPDNVKPGRYLGYTRFDLMGEALGCHGEFVERPQDIRPALERAQAAVRSGRTAVVNVVTDSNARAGTVSFTSFTT
ncbi:thiamine pyrophosphate-binding protein [Mesorhizobium sp. ASY16-5R]|uniref:thiamine pyrophosphate-binding protein n=1 Tax=Mesorhizobium sp. ASY16-5R TaxID=3445772 RepID=UPI003F9EBB90